MNMQDNPEFASSSIIVDYNPFSSDSDSEEEEDRAPSKRQKTRNLADSDGRLTLKAIFFKRRFVGESSGIQVASQLIVGDTVQEVKAKMWDIAKPIVHREVVIQQEDGVQRASWAEAAPRLEDIGKFIILQDPTQKRRVSVEKIDRKALITWRDRAIRVLVHVYSNYVSSKAVWELVEKQLIAPQNPDRAGAPNNQALTALAEELRAKHGDCFTGHSSAWKMWANYIHAAPAHERERRMESLPPNDLLKFFRSVPLSDEIRMANIRRGLGVANVVNDAHAADLDLLDEEADQLIALGQRMKARVAAMRERSTVNANLVTSMADAMRPEETELSRSLGSLVSDMIDVDHQ